MSIPKETLMAYADGELSAEDAHRVEATMAADPNLRLYVEEQLTLRWTLRSAFDDLLAAPVPDHLIAAASAPLPWHLQIRHTLRSLTSRRALMWSAIPAGALACGVAIGVFAVSPRGAQILFDPHGLVARGALAVALNEELSGQPARTAAARIGISFKNAAGRYCRTFETRGEGALAGVACHQGGAWHIAVLTSQPREEEPGAAYQLAGSTMPDAVRAAVDSMISGAPLDAAAERAARAEAWSGR